MKHLKFTSSLVIAVVITFLYLLQSCGGVHYNSYVEDYKDLAIEEMIRTGYPASIKLAQAILESEGGRNELAADYNNHFGILCNSKWKGQKHRITEEDFATGERLESCYKVYDSPEASFVAHTNLLKKDPYYKSLFQLKSSSYVLWAERLMELGYTSNETYDLTLINMIEKYNLDAYDNIALGYDPEVADISDQEMEEVIPSTFDYQDDQLIDHIKAKKERTRINIDDQLATLQEDIANHKSEFSEDRASWKRELEQQLDDTYSGRDYEDRDYEDRDYEKTDHQSSYQTRAERYTSNPYNERVNKRQSNQNEAVDAFDPIEAVDPIDAKYKNLNKRNYPRPTRRAYKESRNQSYSTPNNNQSRSTHQEVTTYSKEDDHSFNAPSEETSISDFEDDYTYINRSKVVYAGYRDSPLTIAKQYDVSVKDIVGFNETVKNNNQLLKEGLPIYLEAKKKNYLNGKKYHIVQTAETMEDISAMYGLLLNELYAKNRMPIGSQPSLGERVKLDKGKIKQRPELRSNYRNDYQTSESIAPPSSVAIDRASKSNRVDQSTYYNQEPPVTTVLLQPVTINNKYHTVKAGESLYSIARLYDLSPEKIMRMNGLRNERINRDMRLIIR